MKPGIRLSIKEGFRIAHQSVAGMVFYAGCWIFLFALAVGLAAVLGLPWKDLLQSSRPPLTQPVQEVSGFVGLFMLAFWFVLAGIWIWFQGGSIAYLSKQLREKSGRIADFVQGGNRSFWPIVGYYAIWLSILFSIVLLIGLISFSFQPLRQWVPGWFIAVVVTLTFLGGLGFLAWLGVRTMLAPFAIVLSGAGPVKALQKSFAATRGLFGKLFGLSVLLGLIGFAVQLGLIVVLAVFRIFHLLPGVFGTVVSLTSNWAILVYFPFVSTAALVRFYDDAVSFSEPAAKPAVP